MKTSVNSDKFIKYQDKIRELEGQSPRFKQVLQNMKFFKRIMEFGNQ